MAAATQIRQTEYYDNITLRKILAKSTINSVLPPFQVLTSDGLGGTYWSTLSSPNAYVSAFQYICTPAAIYTADASFNTIHFKAGTGLGFSTSQYENETVLYGKAFENIQVPLQSKIISSSIAFSSFGMVPFQTYPNSNTLLMEIVYPSLRVGTTILPINDRKSTLNFVPVREIQMEESPTSLAVTGISISTFTSKSYLSTQAFTSTTAMTLYPYMEPFYVLQTEFSTAMSNLSTTITTRNIEYNSTSHAIMSSVMSSLTTYSTFFVNSVSSYVNTVIPYEAVQASSIMDSISTFSSLLGQRMEPFTIASTNTIFSKKNYRYENGDISNNIFIIPDLVSSVSTSLGLFYESSATEAQLLSTNTFLLNYMSTTIYKTIPSTTASLMSSFSTSMFRDFQNLTASTVTRVNFVSTLKYNDFRYLYNTLANGMNYDLTVSTAQLNLSPLIKFIDSDSKIFLQYNANYSFRNIRRYISDGKVISVNEFPVCTFLTYNDIPVPNAAFSDFIQFSIYPSTPTSTLTQAYSKQFFFPIDTSFYLQNYQNPYKVVHFHSSIIYFDNKHAQSNVFGGIVYPNTFTCDCALINYTTVEWKNNIDASTICYKVVVENGLNYSK